MTTSKSKTQIQRLSMDKALSISDSMFVLAAPNAEKTIGNAFAFLSMVGHKMISSHRVLAICIILYIFNYCWIEQRSRWSRGMWKQDF